MYNYKQILNLPSSTFRLINILIVIDIIDITAKLTESLYYYFFFAIDFAKHS
jgi:hypothetical protein